MSIFKVKKEINPFYIMAPANPLGRDRENEWSLFGLMQSLQAQGKKEQAAEIEERFRKAWNQAEVSLTALRYQNP